jgi:hypothetical protein
LSQRRNATESRRTKIPGFTKAKPFQEELPMRKNTKRSAVVAGVATVIIGGGVAAWAVTGWDIGGSGTANASASEVKDLHAISTFNHSLYPGFEAQMATTVGNDNEFPVKLKGTVGITDVSVTPASDACKAGVAAPGVLTTTFPGTPTIPAGEQNFEISATVKVGELPQACAGRAIAITYSLPGTSTNS